MLVKLKPGVVKGCGQVRRTKMSGCGLELCRSEPVIKECQAEKGHTETPGEKEGSKKEGQDAMPGWSSSL